MRKKPAILFGFLVVTLISMSTISSVQAPYISGHYWIDPEYMGYDDLKFHDWIVAYVAGTTAKLRVPFYNSYSTDITVTSVEVWFDWGDTYTTSGASIDPYETEIFEITFTVPPTTTASNLFMHSYRITVEYEHDTWTDSDTEYGYNFVVFSADQADAFPLWIELNALLPLYFSTANASVLEDKAEAELSAGEVDYMYGDFAGAKESFQAGLDLIDQAFEAEEEKGPDLEEAMIQGGTQGGMAAKKEADAAMTQAYAWMLFGLGMILIGIGAIVYAAKKPKVATAA